VLRTLSRRQLCSASTACANVFWRRLVWAAFGVVALLIPATLFEWASLAIAVLIHEGATVLVVINALRLLRLVDSADHGDAAGLDTPQALGRASAHS